MKWSIIILFLISSYSLSQNWTYEGYDKSKKFGHQYWFSFQNVEDTSTYNHYYSELKKDSKNLELIIRNNDGEFLPFANIIVRNIFTDSTINFSTNVNGKAIVKVPFEKFEIRISFLGYDSFTFILSSLQGKKISAKINLGKGPDLVVYQINSKRKLSDEKVESIILCVKEVKRNNPSYGCEKKRKYYISIQI